MTSKQRNTPKIWPKVGVVVLNWNGWRDTIECLRSLQLLNYPNYQIIVVDNGSTDGSVDRVRAAFPTVPLLQTGANLGYAGDNNRGIASALGMTAEYVLVLNNDVRVAPDALNVMIHVAQETGASVVGAVVTNSSGDKVLFTRSLYPAMLLFSEPQGRVPNKEWWPSDQVNGAAMLLRNDLLLERERSLGYFLDESLALYCEEIELALWCRKMNRKCIVAGRAIVRHKESASTGGPRKPLQFYYVTRNRILIARERVSPPLSVLFAVLFPLTRLPRAAIYLTKGERGIARAILHGLSDGYRGVTGVNALYVPAQLTSGVYLPVSRFRRTSPHGKAPAGSEIHSGAGAMSRGKHTSGDSSA